MKSEFKNKNFTLYQHRNNVTGDTYVGVTSKKPEYRWNNGKGYRKNDKFNSDIIKYGWDNFTHSILGVNLSFEEANEDEASLINAYKMIGKSYNLESGGYNDFSVADSTRKKLSKAFSGSNNPNYGKFGKDNPCSLKIIQIDRKSGKVIKIWDSIADAERETGIASSNITAAAKGRYKSAGGWVWQYYVEPDKTQLN